MLRVGGHAGADHAAVDEDRDAQLHAGGIDRIHFRVVNRHLRELAAREAADCFDVVLGFGFLDASHGAHHIVRADFVGEEEPPRVPSGCFQTLLAQAGHRPLNAPAIHLPHRPFNRVFRRVDQVGHILEHVFGREFKHPQRVGILEERLHECVSGFLILNGCKRKPHPKVDNPAVKHSVPRGRVCGVGVICCRCCHFFSLLFGTSEILADPALSYSRHTSPAQKAENEQKI